VGADLAIVIPTRNRRALVGRLLRNLRDLDGSLLTEIVVIDEGSSDGTASMIVEEFRDLRVSVHRNDVPVGLPSARNLGASLTSAPLIAWIDDDDVTAPTRFASQVQLMRAERRRWSFAGRVDIDDDYNMIGFRCCPDPHALLSQLSQCNVIPSMAQGVVMERELFEDSGGFDPSFRAAEDWEMGIRVLRLAEPAMLDAPLVGYRVAPGSMSKDTSLMEAAIAEIGRKHGADIDWLTVHRSLMLSDMSANRRRALARCARIAQAGGSLEALVLGGLATLSPSVGAAMLRARRRSAVPDQWRAAARPWLDRICEVERAAASGSVRHSAVASPVPAAVAPRRVAG
jgi:glycosyltransferase involved in cell wall biosynthesis